MGCVSSLRVGACHSELAYRQQRIEHEIRPEREDALKCLDCVAGLFGFEIGESAQGEGSGIDPGVDHGAIEQVAGLHGIAVIEGDFRFNVREQNELHQRVEGPLLRDFGG